MTVFHSARCIRDSAGHVFFSAVRRINRDFKQITTATPTTAAHCACLEMTFRRSAKSYKVKTCLVAQSLLRVFLLFLTVTGFKIYHRFFFFTLYQESIQSVRFSSNNVFPAFPQFKISYPQPTSNTASSLTANPGFEACKNHTATKTPRH